MTTNIQLGSYSLKQIKKLKNCIYRIVSPTGRVYIGQTNNFWRRYRTYRNYKTRKDVKTQIKLYRSLVKYGFESHIFEIVTECDPPDLDRWEISFIKKYDATSKANLNCLGGGNSPRTPSPEMVKKRADKLRGRKCAEETKKKIGIANSGPKNGMYGKTPWNKGKKHSATTIEKCRAASLGNTTWRGKKHTLETRRKMSLACRGKNKGKLNPQFKGLIYAYNSDGNEIGKFESLQEAAKFLNIKMQGISKVCLGRTKSYRGYYFRREPID